jgi:hypothetical protein
VGTTNNRWNILGFNFTKSDALSTVYKISMVKPHIRTVVRIFRIWTGVPDVVYLAGNFCFENRKIFAF